MLRRMPHTCIIWCLTAQRAAASCPRLRSRCPSRTYHASPPAPPPHPHHHQRRRRKQTGPRSIANAGPLGWRRGRSATPWRCGTGAQATRQSRQDSPRPKPRAAPAHGTQNSARPRRMKHSRCKAGHRTAGHRHNGQARSQRCCTCERTDSRACGTPFAEADCLNILETWRRTAALAMTPSTTLTAVASQAARVSPPRSGNRSARRGRAR
mmetsp:Transcript_50738/g.114058  ORF Transcript_50738/g.114058 Transcript_50738/m.114058 type:complete len:210 (+) Transcript_50738:318-947(+)